MRRKDRGFKTAVFLRAFFVLSRGKEPSPLLRVCAGIMVFHLQTALPQDLIQQVVGLFADHGGDPLVRLFLHADGGGVRLMLQRFELFVCFLDACLSIYFSFSALLFMSLFLMSFACSFGLLPLYYELFQGVTKE